jgi:hypothetical protein
MLLRRRLASFRRESVSLKPRASNAGLKGFRTSSAEHDSQAYALLLQMCALLLCNGWATCHTSCVFCCCHSSCTVHWLGNKYIYRSGAYAWLSCSVELQNTCFNHSMRGFRIQFPLCGQAVATITWHVLKGLLNSTCLSICIQETVSQGPDL